MTKENKRKSLIFLSMGIVFTCVSLKTYANEGFAGDLEKESHINPTYKINLEEDRDRSLEKYTIKFNTNGGSGISDIEYLVGEKITYPEDPDKDDYIFDGWYRDKALKKPFSFNRALKEDISLYAKWKDKYVEISFDTKGGNKIEKIKLKNDQVLDFLPKPRKRGYEFRGWYIDGKFKDRFRPKDKISKNIKLFARWEEEKGNIKVNVEIYDSRGKRKIKKDDFIVNEKDHIVKILERAIRSEKKAPNFYVNGKGEFESFDNIDNSPSYQWNIFINNERVGYKDLKNYDLEEYDKIEMFYQWNYVDKYKSLINMDLVGTYINGYSDGTFRPENNISREEVAMVLHRIIDEDMLSENIKKIRFDDVDDSHWAAEAIAELSRLSVINGYDGASFTPKGSVTRGEIAVLLARMAKIKLGSSSKFNDTINYWGNREINAVSDAGWINGYGDGSFRPNDRITRGELVAIINRVLGRNRIRYEVNPFIDLDVSKWYYDEILKAF